MYQLEGFIMTIIARHPSTFNLIAKADAAHERGDVSYPWEYVEIHLDEYDNPEVLSSDIQDIYEARAYH